jgi:hypothetical protein
MLPVAAAPVNAYYVGHPVGLRALSVPGAAVLPDAGALASSRFSTFYRWRPMTMLADARWPTNSRRGIKGGKQIARSVAARARRGEGAPVPLLRRPLLRLMRRRSASDNLA